MARLLGERQVADVVLDLGVGERIHNAQRAKPFNGVRQFDAVNGDLKPAPSPSGDELHVVVNGDHIGNIA